MAAASFLQPSFLGGEVSRSIQGRFDDEKYRTWMQVCLNSMPLEEGAWARRTGSLYCGHTRLGRRAKLFNFNFLQVSPYTMEFTVNVLRFRDGPAMVTTNDDATIAAISAAAPAKVTTAAPHGWTTGNQVIFKNLGANNPQLQNRQFMITVTSATEFTLTDALTSLAVDGVTLGTFVSGTVDRILEIPTPYNAAQFFSLRSVQADIPLTNGVTPGSFLLSGSIKPYLLQVVTPPTEVADATFTLAPAVFKDGPYFDPVPGGTLATPSALQGNIQLALSFNAYDATKSYSIGDYVVSVGINYKSLTDANLGNTPASSPTFWVPVSAADAIGTNGFVGTDIGRHVRLFSEPQIWDKTVAYNKDTVVAYGGSGNQYIGATYWISLVAANTNNIPGGDLTKWSIYPTGARWTWGRITGLSNIINRALAGSTSIGDLTGGGGLTPLFDGNLNQTVATGASKTIAIPEPGTTPGTLTLAAYGGKNYTGATDQKIASVTVYGSIDRGLAGGFWGFGLTSPIVTTITVNLRGKASAPANGADGTLLGTSGPIPATLAPISVTSTDQTTAWKFIWVEIIASGFVNGAYTFSISVAEISYYAPAGTGTSAGVTVQIVGDPLLYATPIRVWRLGLYSDTTSWPTCGTWHEGRLWLSGVVANRIDSSKSNDPFTFSPTNPDGSVAGNNGISYTFNSPDVNPIFWLMPDREGIICGTQSGEWLVQATSNNVPLTPVTIQAHRMTTYNMANIEPRRTNNTIAAVQNFRRDLLEFFADVYAGKFVAQDLALQAKHLVAPNIENIGYQQEVIPIIWVQCADGSLKGTTYARTSLVSAQGPTTNAWHRHLLGSGRTVDNICIGANADGTLDALMMSTYDGATYHVEMMTTLFRETDSPVNGWFLDDAVAPSSTESSSVASPGAPYGGLTLHGLWHLNGKTVQITAGGLDCGQIEFGDIADFVVSNGSVFMPYGDGISAGTAQGKFTAAFVATNPPIVVGFTYTSDGQVVRPSSMQETGARNGPGFGKLRRVQQYTVLVNQTAGLSIGTRFDKLDPVLFNAEGGDPMAFGEVFSGIYRAAPQDDNDFEGALCWRITRPMPATICAIGWHIHTQDI